MKELVQRKGPRGREEAVRTADPTASRPRTLGPSATSACRIARPVRDELRWFGGQARARRVRPMDQFAEQEIVLPDDGGPHAGERYRCSRQPYARLYFAAVMSGLWTIFVATGPTQSGKTMTCCLVPLLYHLFEVGETVIFGLPDMNMAADKWKQDIEPVIGSSRYRDLIPRVGRGSRGGDKFEALTFGNGATLRFMTGGGSDKHRAGFTARVLVVSEADGLDEVGAASRETRKLEQLFGRLRAHAAARRRAYLECTASVEMGYTWWTWEHDSTHSRIGLPCPHCAALVTPERKHLQGWQEAVSEISARQEVAFHCPSCGEAWNEQQRARANGDGVLLHAGQAAARTRAGALRIKGEAPETRTLGFRWSAVNNLFIPAEDVAAEEWRARRAANEEDADNTLRQQVWCLPRNEPKLEGAELDRETLVRRVARWPRGVLPEDTQQLAVGVDLGEHWCYYGVLAGREGGGLHVPDYGHFEAESGKYGVERALLAALREFRTVALAGWGCAGGGTRAPDQVWIDARWQRDVVLTFCQETRRELGRDVFRPAMGHGTTQENVRRYTQPRTTGNVVRHLGEGYHLVRLKSPALLLAEVNADRWKSWLHQRLVVPIDAPGALTLYQAMPKVHETLGKHLTAERQVTEFIAGKGDVVRWERLRRNNHLLDALYNSCAALHLAGWRLLGGSEQAVRQALAARRTRVRVTMPDGRPFMVTERR